MTVQLKANNKKSDNNKPQDQPQQQMEPLAETQSLTQKEADAETSAETYTLDEAEEIPELEPITQLEPDIVSQKREDVRGVLSLVFLVGFFVVLIIGIISTLNISQGDPANNIKEIILTISGVLAGPLGFVIGFYFRSREEK